MITINLLPAELRPIERTILPYLIAVSVLAITILGVGTVYIADIATNVIANNALEENKAALLDLQDVIDENARLVARTNELAARVTAIQQIASDRVVWSQQLHNLVRLAPDNLWFTRLYVHAKAVPIVTQVYDPDTKTMVSVPGIVTQQLLEVSGYVATGRDGNRDIAPFMGETTDPGAEFAQSFKLETVKSVEDGDYQGDPVKKFKIEFVLAKGGQGQ